MKRNLTLLITICLLATAGFLVFRPQQPDPHSNGLPEELVKVTAGYLPMVSSLTYFVAEEKGFFTKHGLSVEATPISTSDLIAQDLIRGEINAAIELAVVPLLNRVENASLFRIFSTSIITEDEGFDGVIVRKDSSIRELKDLAGKEVIVFPGTTAEKTFTAVFKELYPNEALPKFTPKSPTQHIQSLINGECDAVHAYEPFMAEGIVDHDCRKIFGSLYGRQTKPAPNPIGVGAVNARWLKENPETAKKFFAAMDEAVAFIDSNLDESHEILARWTDKRMEVTTRMNIMRMSTTAALDHEVLSNYLRKLVEMKEISAAPPASTICISK